MPTFRSVCPLFAAGALVLVSTGMAAASPDHELIDDLARRAMEAFATPGMAVSVVHDGAVYHSAGYGIAKAGSSDRVDNETLFQIGSVSKAFTTAALAILADEGKLDWDDPVIDHLPEFRLHDPWVTREFTIRDLLTHRSGLPLGAGDLLIFPDGNSTADEVIRALRFLRPATSFRSQYAYDNLLYIVAGELVAAVADMSFPAFLEERLLQPLRMRDCVSFAGRAEPDAALATPHVLVEGKLETTTSRVTSLVAAAGGIACSARGMANWMMFLLNEGAVENGEQLVSREQFGQLIRPVTLLPAPGYLVQHAGSYVNAYALGWGVTSFHGQPMLSHGGAVWGMTTFIAFLPKQDLAVFAAGNQLSAAPRALVYDVIERFLNGTATAGENDWIAILAEASRDRRAAADAVVAEAFASRNADSTPSLPLADYSGTYRDPWYGGIEISLREGRLWFRSERNPPLEGPLEHFQYDTFIARWSDRRLMADAYVTFSLGHDGSIERIGMQAVSPATDFSYDFHDLDLRPLEAH